MSNAAEYMNEHLIPDFDSLTRFLLRSGFAGRCMLEDFGSGPTWSDL